MLLRTNSRPSSIVPWKRPGTSCILRVPSQKRMKIKATITSRSNMMRLSSKIVPSNKMAGGKKSRIDGPLNSGVSVAGAVAKARMGIRAAALRGVSSIGAKRSASRRSAAVLLPYQENEEPMNGRAGFSRASVTDYKSGISSLLGSVTST